MMRQTDIEDDDDDVRKKFGVDKPYHRDLSNQQSSVIQTKTHAIIVAANPKCFFSARYDQRHVV